MSRHLSLVLTVSSLSAVACGGGQTQGAAFDPSWSNDGGNEIAAFQQRFAAEKVPAGADVAIGVSGKKTIVGVPLDGGAPWTFEHALDSRPVVAGSVVVGMGGGALFALDARGGKQLWRRNAGGSLRGAGDDGRTTVVSLSASPGQGSVVLAISHDGVMIRQIEDNAAIGVPAVVGGYAFLPWQGQYVTVYDLHGGGEEARVLLRTQTSHVFAEGGALFFGETGATRFDDKIRLAPANQASTTLLPARELPATPKWLRPGTEVIPIEATALDSVRLYARPTASGPAGFDAGRFAATYYRIAVGLDAQSGSLAWAHGHDAEFIGGDAYGGGFALCDASGKVTFLDATSGAVAGSVSLGRRIDACIVQADGFTKAAPPGSGAKGGDQPPGTTPLAEQLAKVIMMPEAEHVMIQRLLIREMAALEDESVTKVLIDLASSPRTPPMLLDDARKALSARRNGVDFMLQSLARRYDFLADVLRPPPVGPLADALAALKEKRAAPLLAVHLNDPADTPDDTRRAAAALAVLADKGELRELQTFFANYRCMAEDEITGDAVVSTAQALVKVGGGHFVADAIKDPATTAALKPRLEALVRAKDAGKPGAAGDKAAKPGAAGSRPETKASAGASQPETADAKSPPPPKK